MEANATQDRTEIKRAGRVLARIFVVAGGLFWGIAAFAGPYVYQETSFAASIKTAMWPFLAAIVILVIGWTYERLAAVLLFGAAAAVPAWGVLYNWEIGVWLIMTAVLIVPMVLAGVLYILSARPESERIPAEESQRATGPRVTEVPPRTGLHTPTR